MLSSPDLKDISQHAEARALQNAIYRYMDSAAFGPGQEVAVSAIERLFENEEV